MGRGEVTSGRKQWKWNSLRTMMNKLEWNCQTDAFESGRGL